MNKQQVLENINKEVFKVNWEYNEIEEEDIHKFARHEVLIDGEVSEYEVLYPEHEDIQEIREDLAEAEDNGDEKEIEELEYKLYDRLAGVEQNDVFDYDAVPSVLFNGQYI